VTVAEGAAAVRTFRERASGAVRRHAAAAAVFAALAVVITWPLVIHLRDALPGTGLDDNAGFLWDYWLLRRALASPAHDVLTTTAVFHPDGINLALHTHLLFEALLGATVFAWASLPLALNLTLLCSATLNGFAAYLLAYRLTSNRRASIVAGIFFAASPLLTVHFLGHFNRYVAWPLVVFVAAVIELLRRPSWRSSIVAGLWLAAVAYSDYYYFVYALAFAGLAWICQALNADLIRRQPRRGRLDATLLIVAGVAALVAVTVHVSGGGVLSIGPLQVSIRNGTNVRAIATGALLWWLWRRRRWTPSLALSERSVGTRVEGGLGARLPVAPFAATTVMAVVCVVAMLPLLERAWALWRAGDYLTQPFVWRNAPPGIDIGALAMGNAFHSWWGGAVTRVYRELGIDGLAPQLWLGIAVPVLLYVTAREWMADRAARVWLLWTTVFLVWAAGPFLRVFGIDTGLPLPQILMRYVPVLSNARLPAHVGVLVYLGIAMLLAFAIARSRHNRSMALAGALAGLVLVEFAAAPRPMVMLSPPPLFDRLAAMPDGALLDLPIGIRDGFGSAGRFDATSLYHQTIHGKPLVSGYVSRLLPSVRRRYDESPAMQMLFALSSGGAPAAGPTAREAAAELVERWRVTYVVIDERVTPPALQAFVDAMGARLIGEDHVRRLYVLRGAVD
jgi:hypothetical protein